ncbi:hypothetical protein ACERUH_001723 [Campylobacter jejuni]
MQIPIYSKLKTKLESKGIDNISSGQIAWFVCSVGIFIIPMVYFISVTIMINSLFYLLCYLFLY